MKKSLIILTVIIAATALTAGIVQAAATHNVTTHLGPAGDIYQVEGTMKLKSVMIGEQGVGGVTYFNGSIVNNTTESSVDNPVTFGDNVRVDGRVWRGATAGPGDTAPFIVNDDMEVTGDLTTGDIMPAANSTYSLGAPTNQFKDAFFNGTVWLSGTVLGDSVIGTALLENGGVRTNDLADDSVTPAKISGTGGANLPIAYGYCNSDGTTQTATSNVSTLR